MLPTLCLHAVYRSGRPRQGSSPRFSCYQLFFKLVLCCWSDRYSTPSTPLQSVYVWRCIDVWQRLAASDKTRVQNLDSDDRDKAATCTNKLTKDRKHKTPLLRLMHAVGRCFWPSTVEVGTHTIRHFAKHFILAMDELIAWHGDNSCTCSDARVRNTNHT